MKRLILKFCVLTTLLVLTYLPYSGSTLTDEESFVNNSITAGCWSAPSVPVLLSPGNNTYAGSGSPWDLDPRMDWDDSSIYCDAPNTLRYQYESYSDAALTHLLYQSAWLTDSQIPAPGTPDGVYYWRVRAKDGQENISEFSLPWKFTVDRVNPATPSLSVTGSYTKAVEERLTNGNFETGDISGWTTAGNVTVLNSDTVTDPALTINPANGNYMVRLGDSADPGNFVWENRLMQSFATGAKSISLRYNYFSRDYGPFDDPGFFIRLGGQEVFRLATSAVNSGGIGDAQARSTDWQEFYYDLSSQNNSQTNLAIYAGNTGDKSYQSWAYVDQFTTYFVSAPLHASYSLSGNDNPSGSGLNRFEYNLDSTSWTPIAIGVTFTISSGGEHNLQYRSIDNANNHSDISTVRLIVDATPPNDITDLASTSISANQATLTWTAPGNDGSSGKSSTYDLRYSTSPITTANFDSATKIDHLPSPQTSGASETFEVTGLNPSTTYYFAIKSADEAPNWSDVSNVITLTTTAGLTLNRGDIVINEILWIGGTNPEQIIEVRNTTDRLFTDLSTLSLKLGGTEVVNFAGTTLPPHGYLLISTLNNSDTNIGNTASTIDIPNAVLDLPRTVLDLALENNSTQIDLAWTTLEPVTEGVFDTTSGAEKYYSMERLSTPGEGDDPLNWYTCIDAASGPDFFKVVVGVDFRGTPKADNRSENEPLAHLRPASRQPTTTPTPRLEPSIALTPVDKDNKITLNISDLFTSVEYEIKYTNSAGEQGFGGKLDITDIVNGQISRQFYLGTCSSGGICIPDADIGSTANVTLTSETVNLSKTFTIKP